MGSATWSQARCFGVELSADEFQLVEFGRGLITGSQALMKATVFFVWTTRHGVRLS
jgi:hypothetical protein